MKLAMIQTLGCDISHYEKTANHVLHLVECTCKTDADMILLPECAYPAYFIGLDEQKSSLAGTARFMDDLSILAQKYSKYIATGIALQEKKVLYNSLVVFDRSGKLVCQTNKSNLWHFDSKWFSQGEESNVFDTEFGRIGIMVCADGRIPEIARMLRLQGAGLILDAVNLVASAETPQELSNQQYQYILQTRARENGVYIAVCDKAGSENNSVTFLGRSFVAAPNGDRIVECTSTEEEICTCEITLPKLSLLPRIPSLYGELIKPTDQLAAFAAMNRPYLLNELELFTSMVRFEAFNGSDYLEKAIHYLHVCELMDAKLIVLPTIPSNFNISIRIILELCSALQSDVTVAVSFLGEDGTAFALFAKKNGVVGILHKTHGVAQKDDTRIESLSLYPGCSVSAVFGAEMEVPEITRIAMLKGADLVLWFDENNDQFYLKLMQTRAAENKIFVARSGTSLPQDRSLIVNPDGSVICTTFHTSEQVASGMIHTALSKAKELIPGTNLITGRKPDFYKEMTI